MRTLVSLASLILLSSAGVAVAQQAPEPSTALSEANASPQATTVGEMTFGQLMGYLRSSFTPDAAATPLAPGDIQAIVVGTDVKVLPVSELEGWAEEKGELEDLMAERGQSLDDLHTAIEARPALVEMLQVGGYEPEDVLLVSNPGTGSYTFYVRPHSQPQ